MKSLQNLSCRLAFGRHIPGFRALNRLLYRRDVPGLERHLAGLSFRNPVGLAAGFDREAKLVDPWSDLGFSYVGVRIDSGNIRTAVQRLQYRDSDTLVAAELRPFSQSEDEIRKEIVRSFSFLYDFVDLFIVHISGTAGMSYLDDVTGLGEILDELLSLRLCYGQEKPIIVRLDSYLSASQIEPTLDYCLLSGIDGIALSGLDMARKVIDYTHGRLPVIGCGAFSTPEEAIAMLQAGATLIELEGAFLKPSKIISLLHDQGFHLHDR